MKTLFQDISDFHQRFGLEYQGPIRAGNPELTGFRHKFAVEEADEYHTHAAKAQVAMTKDVAVHHLEHMFDAFIDQLYVLIGSAYLHGVTAEMMQEGWDRVHAANMQKVRATSSEQSARGSTLDVVKPKGWTAPDLYDIVISSLEGQIK